MTYKVGAKGQVVLPKAMRERLGIRPGDEVLFDEGDGEITVRKAKSKAQLVDELMGSLAGSGLLEEYAEGKRRDREREERKYGRY
ncbi:AbrB/MazE/SpoVT family DNA-binding domain-containing protein [Conexibacter woesei]|uniref:Transcriptional regulator, AbrB family n=1 Tax=Conexibacter woesei (strain DSM 14684 / CCUG 47730 / CIP 108061 / JCM 11494 / NBRC 100937 / ID131577) TaxID=469383 RepID=D3F1I7_CONWI|nr:AbrB/MazE/SpoVT family DNA-binding domain-containing protein [Conexibacter woesei]ADB52150.1 transcriptional regulator, AbrB family [Conexibacter woesei DSM 14684]